MSTASRTPSSGSWRPDIELGNQSEIDLWVPVALDPALASRSERQWRPGRPAGRRRRAGRRQRPGDGDRPAAAARVPGHQPRLDVPRRDDSRSPRRRQHLGRPVAALHRRRPAAGARLRQRHEPADRPADRPPPGAGGAHRARRHPRPRRRADRRREPAHRPGRRPRSAWPSPRPGCAASTPSRPSRSSASSPSTSASSPSPSCWPFLAPLVFAIVPTLRVLRLDVRSSLNDASARSVGGAAAARGRVGAGRRPGVAGGDAAGRRRPGRAVDGRP